MKQIQKGARFDARSIRVGFDRAIKQGRRGRDAIHKLLLRKNKEWVHCARVRQGDFARHLVVFLGKMPLPSFFDRAEADKYRKQLQGYAQRFRKQALRAYQVSHVPPDKIVVALGGPGAWCLKAARTYIKKSAP